MRNKIQIHANSFRTILAALLSIFVLLAAAAYPSLHHWSIVPILTCGYLVIFQPVLRHIFHPGWLFTILGFHFFCLSPLIEIIVGRPLVYTPHVSDIRPWLGWMATLNVVGLGLFALANKIPFGTPKSLWILNERKLIRILTPMILVSGGVQFLVFARFGGIGGYIEAYESRDGSFSGFGVIFMISEAFPILMLILYAVLARRRPAFRTLFVVSIVLVAFFSLQLLFGGLRGSRSNTIWGLFWATGIIHLYVRRLPRIVFACGALVLLAFMFAYGAYKTGGMELIQEAAESRFDPDAMPEGRGVLNLLLGDLSRANVQAAMLRRLIEHDESYDYPFGRTYLGALAMVIPRSLWSTRPQTKVVEGTDLLLGKGAYLRGMRSSQVYGLAGEAMLNFGPMAIPLAYLLYGIAFRFISRRLEGLNRQDSRWLLAPFTALLMYLIVVSDSDNIVFFVFKNGALPFLAIFLASDRVDLPRNRDIASLHLEVYGANGHDEILTGQRLSSSSSK